MTPTRKLLILNFVLAVAAASLTWSLRHEPANPPNNPVDENAKTLKMPFPEKRVSIIDEGNYITEIHRNEHGVKILESHSRKEGIGASVKMWSDEGDIISHFMGAYGTPVWNMSNDTSEELDFYLLRKEAISGLYADTEKLYIKGNPLLADEHLVAISKLYKLQTLDIRDCSGVTGGAVERLKMKMPNTVVLHD
jgi:hypothetical protein